MNCPPIATSRVVCKRSAGDCLPTPPDKRPRALEIDSSWRLSPTSDKPELPPIIDSATFSLHIPFPYSAFAEHQRAGLVVVEFDTRRFPAACPVFGYDATARRALVQFICGVAARCVGTASREGVAAEVVAAWKTLLAAYGLRFASCMTLAARHTLQRITGTLVCESTQMLAGGESVAQFHSRCGPALDASHRESFWSGLIGSAPPAVVMAWLNSSECRDPLAAVNLFCSPTWGEDAPAVTLFPFHQFPRYMLTALAPLRQTEVGLGRLTTGPQPVLDYSTSRIVPMLLREGVSATITSRLRAARALMHSHYVCIKSRSTTGMQTPRSLHSSSLTLFGSDRVSAGGS